MKNQNWWKITVSARVSLLSEMAGGRAQAISEKFRYSPNHKLKEGLFCMGTFLKVEGGILYPGNDGIVNIVFLVIEPLCAFFKVGMIWDIHEGERKIGTGEILSVDDVKQNS